MTYLLEKYGKDGIDVIYSHNDSMTLGVLDILEKNGIRPAQDIILITVDGEKEAVEVLKAGKINCVVQCSPDLGDEVMKLVQDLKAGKKITTETLVLWGADGLVERFFEPLKCWAKFGDCFTGHTVPFGHFIPEEAPIPMLEAVLKFL